MFIPLKPEVQTLELLSKINTGKKYRLSANLNRVTLTPHQNSFLLEDKNYKNALLINRRRSHRILLTNDDILDVGEMVLLYRNPELSFNNLNRNLEGSLMVMMVTLGDVLIRFNLSKTKFRQMPRQKIEATQKTQTT